jgi:poly-gamma-glutamate synthase PgsB/CapB
VCVSVFLVYLLVERTQLERKISRIPLRICITGTRGKSSVVRLIAAGLRNIRLLVLAKTTGSKACLIFPDGKESEIRRRGSPTILEGKKALAIASRAGVHAVVLEMMSIRPEFLRIEAIRMIKPHILIVTNVRKDHVDELGKTKDEIARAFALAIPEKSTVIIPEEEFYPVFEKRAEKVNAKLILVPKNLPIDKDVLGEKSPVSEFEQNFRIAVAVSKFLGKDQTNAYRAAKRAFPDFGSLKVWQADVDSPMSGWYFVSAFAANDPESTWEALVKLENRGLFKGKKRIGLINLRKDRGGRTLQWFGALQGEETNSFDRLFLVGDHAHVLRDRLRGRISREITVVKGKKPEDLIANIFALEREESVVFGMGNMAGMGRQLVDYWERTGKTHDI